MKVLRTPDHRFKNLKDFPFEPNYTNIKDKSGVELRIHHLDEGQSWTHCTFDAWTASLVLSLQKNDSIPHQSRSENNCT